MGPKFCHERLSTPLSLRLVSNGFRMSIWSKLAFSSMCYSSFLFPNHCKTSNLGEVVKVRFTTKGACLCHWRRQGWNLWQVQNWSASFLLASQGAQSQKYCLQALPAIHTPQSLFDPPVPQHLFLATQQMSQLDLTCFIWRSGRMRGTRKSMSIVLRLCKTLKGPVYTPKKGC